MIIICNVYTFCRVCDSIIIDSISVDLPTVNMEVSYLLQANEDLRKQLRVLNIPFWRLAEALCVHEQTIVRRFRRELPEDERQKIRRIIADLSKEANT